MPTSHSDRQVKRLLIRLDEDPKISESNRKILKEFHRFLVLNNYSEARKQKYLASLVKIVIENDINLKTATKEDIEKLVYWIQMRKDINDTTRRDYRVLIKRFYKWVNKGTYPKSVLWIKTTEADKNGKLPEEMLDENDIKALIKHCRSPRDRALISLLWETGARMGELIDLKMNSFESNKYGLKIIVDGKTGQRRLPLIDAVPYINAWLESHPCREKMDSPVWVNIGTRNNSLKMEYPSIIKMLRSTAKRAGVDKPMHPHHFRHSRATYLATRFTEAQLCQWFGWVLGSDVPARYVHLSGRDIDIEYARLHGIEEEEHPKESKMTPKECLRCHSSVAPDMIFCYHCGMALTIEDAMKIEESQQKLVSAMAELDDADMNEVLKFTAKMFKLIKDDPELAERISKGK